MHVQGLQRTFKNHVKNIFTFAYCLYMYMPLNHPWSLLVIVWLLLVPTNVHEIGGETTVLEGSNLHLTCNASGLPEPNITWTKEEPGNLGNYTVVKQGKVLTITNINRNDAGDYTCTAYNGFGKPQNQTVYVNVNCEYMHWKKPWLMLNRDALSFNLYFLCYNVWCQLRVLMFG